MPVISMSARRPHGRSSCLVADIWSATRRPIATRCPKRGRKSGGALLVEVAPLRETNCGPPSLGLPPSSRHYFWKQTSFGTLENTMKRFRWKLDLPVWPAAPKDRPMGPPSCQAGRCKGPRGPNEKQHGRCLSLSPECPLVSEGRTLRVAIRAKGVDKVTLFSAAQWLELPVGGELDDAWEAIACRLGIVGGRGAAVRRFHLTMPPFRAASGKGGRLAVKGRKGLGTFGAP